MLRVFESVTYVRNKVYFMVLEKSSVRGSIKKAFILQILSECEHNYPLLQYFMSYLCFYWKLHSRRYLHIYNY